MATIQSSKKRTGQCQITIEGDMSIYSAMEMRGELQKLLDKCDSMEFDLSGVSELDTSGFQLLLQIKKQCNAAGKEVLLSSHSPAVLEVLELYGVEEYFGDPLVLPAE